MTDTKYVDPHLQAAQRRAVEAVNLIANDEAITLAVQTVVKAGEDTKRGPLAVLWALRARLGDKIDTFPVPGSKELEGERSNEPKDVYRFQKRKDNGDKTWATGSFYKDFADDHPLGQQVGHVLAGLAAASKVPQERYEYEIGGKKYSNADFMAMPVIERKQQRKRFEAQRTAIRSAFRRAFLLHFHFAEVKEWGIGIKIATKTMDGVEVLTNGTYPIHVWNPDNPTEDFEVLSVPQFLAMRLDKAKDKAGANPDNGAKFAAFKNSGGRGTKAGETGTTKKYTQTSAEEDVAALGSYLETEEGTIAFLKRLTSKDKTDPLLITAVDLGIWLKEHVLSNPELMNRRSRLALEQNEREERAKARETDEQAGEAIQAAAASL